MMYDLGVGTPLGLDGAGLGLAGLAAGYVLTITPGPAVVAGGDLRGHRCRGRRDGDPGRQVAHRPGGLVHRRLFVVVPVVTVAAAVLSPLLVPLGRWCCRRQATKWKAIPE